jgi:hypothetical protein
VLDERIALTGERAPEQYVPWGYNRDLALFNDTADARHAAKWSKYDERKEDAQQNAAASMPRASVLRQAAADGVASILNASPPPADGRLGLKNNDDLALGALNDGDTRGRRMEELKGMKELFEMELIDEAEYKEQKKAILAKYI